MTAEEIQTVENELASRVGEFKLLKIQTFRNPKGNHDAPKFLTRLICENPNGEEPLVVDQNSLAVLRHVKQQEKYKGAGA